MDFLLLLMALAFATWFIATIVYAGWIMLRTGFRLLGYFGQHLGVIEEKPCINCRAPISVFDSQCQACGYDATIPVSRMIRLDLAATARQLRRFLRQQVLEQSDFDRLTELLKTEQDRLTSPFQPAVQRRMTPEEAIPLQATARHAVPATPKSIPLAAEAPLPAPDVETISVAPRHASPPPIAPVLPRTPPPVPPAQRKPPMTAILHAFMEEKNIRWGELISGMLIVGSALGLVISLWSTLREAIPYFPALLFMGVTVALHAAGLYTSRRWKLESTSHGLLVIATLLIPLNFLALIALSEGRLSTDPFFLLGAVAGLGIFGYLTRSAASVLGFSRSILLTGVIGCSAAQLVIARRAEPEMASWLLWSLAALPLVGYLASGLGILRAAPLEQDELAPKANSLLLLLGISAFSLVLAEGLFLFKVTDIPGTLERLAPLVALAALPIQGLGLLLHRRLESSQWTAGRMQGASLAILGSFIQLASLVLAWPNAESLIALGSIHFIVLSALSFVFRLPVLHAGAIGSLALAVLVGYFHFSGELDGSSGTLRAALLSPTSALLLTLLELAVALARFGLRKFDRDNDSEYYGWSAIGLGALSIVVAGYAWGLTLVDHPLSPLNDFVRPLSRPDGDLIALVFAIQMVVILVANFRLQRAGLSALAAGLILATSLHSLLFNQTVAAALAAAGVILLHPTQTAFLLSATVTSLLGMALGGPKPLQQAEAPTQVDYWSVFTLPMTQAAIGFSALGIVSFLAMPGDEIGPAAWMVAWTGLIWLAIAWLNASPHLYWMFQAAITVTLSLVVSLLFRNQPWWEGLKESWMMPWHMQAQACALAVSSLCWQASRPMLRRKPLIARLLDLDIPTVDRFVNSGILAGLLILALYSSLPSIGLELGIVSTDAILPLAAVGALGFVALLAYGVVPTFFDRAPREWAVVLGLVALVFSSIFLPTDLIAYWTSRGIDPSVAAGAGSWVALVLLAAAFFGSLRERFSSVVLFGLILAGQSAPLFSSTLFASAVAAASALRWGLAIYGILLAGLLWGRGPVARLMTRAGWPGWNRDRAALVEWLRGASLVVSAGPLAGLTLAAFFQLQLGVRFGGPVEGFFVWLGPALSYAIPIAVVGLTLKGHAVRERQSWYYLAGGLVLNGAVTAALVIPKLLAREPITELDAIFLAHANLVTTGVDALIWLMAWRWIEPASDRPAPFNRSWPLAIQLAIGARGNLLLLALAGYLIFMAPDRPSAVVERLGSPLAFLSAGLAATAVVCYRLMRSGMSLRTLRWQTSEVAAGEVAPLESATEGSTKQWYQLGPFRNAFIHLTIVSALALAVLVAAALHRPPHLAGWLGYHVLSYVQMSLLALLAVAAWRYRQPVLSASGDATSVPTTSRVWAIRADVAGWGVFLSSLLLLFAWRAAVDDPARPWLSAGGALAVAALAINFGLIERKWSMAYASMIFVMLATTFVMIGPWIGLWQRPYGRATVELIEANIIALCVASAFWLGVQLWFQRRWSEDFGLNGGSIVRTATPSANDASPTASVRGLSEWPAHVVGAAVAYATLAFLVLLFCWSELATVGWMPSPDAPGINDWSGWLTIGAVAVLLVGLLWDRRSRSVTQGLYWLGFMAVAVPLHGRGLTHDELLFKFGQSLALYVLLTAVIWLMRHWVSAIAKGSGISVTASAADDIHAWLAPLTQWIVGFEVVLNLWVVWTFSNIGLRVDGATVVALLALAVGCLGSGPQRQTLRLWSLSLAALSAVYLGWAILPAAPVEQIWLDRAICLFVVLSGMTFLYGGVLVRTLPQAWDWTAALRRCSFATGVIAVATLVGTVALEGALYYPAPGEIGAPVSRLEIVIVAVAIVALAAALLSMAILPKEKRIGLGLRFNGSADFSDQVRRGFVFAAEAALALLFAHFYFTVPELFTGVIRDYWTLIVMAIAFAGVGFSEIAQRSKVSVISEPLRQTGALLPLLPVIGFWIASSATNFSTLLFVVGLLYATLSVSQKSFTFGLLAALAGNAGLWAVLMEQGQLFTGHPQLWLIPPALSVLIAAYLNREQMPESELTAIRYLCVMVIYVSSTADMFITGVGESLWLPMVLAALSVIGVLAGIMLQVRSFLYLGSSFLLLSILSMVWHAARNIGHVWPWWVFGITLGVAILVMFGLFEKKRNEVLELFDGLKQWQP